MQIYIFSKQNNTLLHKLFNGLPLFFPQIVAAGVRLCALFVALTIDHYIGNLEATKT
jgi:hypothetical protein